MIMKILTETQWILWRTCVGTKLKSLYPTTDSELLLSNDDIFRKKLRKAFRDTVNRSRCCEATGNQLCFPNSSAVHHLLDQLSNLYCTDFRDTTTGHCTNNADSDMIIDISINPENISLNTDSLKLKLYEMPFNQDEKNKPISMPDPTEEWLTSMLQENTSDNKGVTSVNEDDGKLIIDETPPERPKRKRKPRKLLLEELAMTDDENGEEEEEEEEGKRNKKKQKRNKKAKEPEPELEPEKPVRQSKHTCKICRSERLVCPICDDIPPSAKLHENVVQHLDMVGTNMSSLATHLDEELVETSRNVYTVMDEAMRKSYENYKIHHTYMGGLRDSVRSMPIITDPLTGEVKVKCSQCHIHCMGNWTIPRKTGRPRTDVVLPSYDELKKQKNNPKK